MIEYIILAIIQGLLEWLPVSSSGQVMIVSMNVFGLTPEKAFSLAIWLHLGTTFAVIFKFRKDFINIFKSFLPNKFTVEKEDENKRNWLIIATIGTAFTALPLYFIFKEALLPIQGDIITLMIAGLLIATGIILLKTRKDFGNNSIKDASEDDIYKDGFIAGLIQGVAILPGISRSGITTSAILLEDYEQDSALKLCFLMSVPVALASIAVDILFGNGSVIGTLDFITIGVVTIVSFIVGYLTIELLIRLAQKIEFGYFCLLYGIIAFAVIIPFLLVPGSS
jgi:undecaprenyl-diphosphatase